MAEFDIPGLNYQRHYFSPHGNMSQIRATLDLTGKARAAVDLDYVMKLPQGVTITKVEMVVRDAAATGDNIDVGTKQKGNGDWPDDLDYFFDGATVAVAGYADSLAVTRHKELFVSEPNVCLVVDHNSVIASTDNLIIDFYVWYEATGNR